MLNTETNSSHMNPWNYKPWWCQPWSILLTGLGLILGSWLFFHRYWVTGLVAVPVFTWMGFFLLVWPRLVARVLASQEVLQKDYTPYPK
ncbi:DUF6737 family protein [Trichothermofontia sp.]